MSENKDLSSRMPAKVKELDTLIECFLSEIRAVSPALNPAYDPKAKQARQLGIVEILESDDMA